MDVKRHAHIYDDLLKLDIELNYQDVPAPSYIQELIIKCNSYQLKVERFFIEVTRDLAVAERMYTVEKLNINTLRMSILTNDARIKKLPTGKEREAAADEMLEKNYHDLLKLENDVNDLKSILSAIRQKQSTLKSTNADVKSLQKLMEQQINRLNIGHPDDPDVKNLAKAFSDIEKLEEEFELDDVESSVEISQSDDSKDAYEESPVESDVQNVPGEQVALEEFGISDESIVIGDESTPDPDIPDETQEHGSQITEDIGEIKTVSEAQGVQSMPDPSGQQGEDGAGDLGIEDELASLLEEGVSDFFDPRKDDSEHDTHSTSEEADEAVTPETAVEQIPEDEPAVVNDSVADAVNSTETPDIEIDDLDSDSEVESRVSEPPKVEVDLSDLGIDLDLGDVGSPAPTKAAPPTNKKEPTKETGSAKSVKKEEKKEAPPVQTKTADKKKPEVKKSEVEDIDLNDILDGF